jgi:hypothetical protein
LEKKDLSWGQRLDKSFDPSSPFVHADKVHPIDTKLMLDWVGSSDQEAYFEL